MKTSDTLRQVALARPRRALAATRFADAEERSDLLASILLEDTTRDGPVRLALVEQHGDHHRGPVVGSPTPGKRRLARATIGVAALLVAVVILVAVEASPPSGPPRTSLKRIDVVEPGGPIGLSQPVYPVRFQLSIGPTLSSASGASPAYTVTWPSDAQASALQLAQVLGVSTDPETPFVDGGVTFGPPSGPSVQVTSEGGVLTWMYEGSPAARAPLDSSRSGGTGVPSSGTPPTDAQAIAQTRTYLSSLDLASSLGDPQTSDFNGQVGVVVPIVVNSVETNMSFNFIYGPGDTLEMATGVFAEVAPTGDYPTISQIAAVSLLEAQPTYEPLEFLTDCPKDAQGIHVCAGTITSADFGYRSFESAHGAVLLPMWFLDGPRAGGNPVASTIGGVVNAIDPIYLNVETRPTPRSDGGL